MQRTEVPRYAKKVRIPNICVMLKQILLVGNILMVVGGMKDDEVNTDKAYAMSLDPSVSVPSCLMSTICDFPHYFRAATSAIFEDGLPAVCGGWHDRASPVTYFKECYKFNYTDGWTYSGSKNYFSAFAGEDKCSVSSIYFMSLYFNLLIANQGYSSHGDGGVIEVGGHHGGSIDTMEYSEDGETWEIIPTTVPGFEHQQQIYDT